MEILYTAMELYSLPLPSLCKFKEIIPLCNNVLGNVLIRLVEDSLNNSQILKIEQNILVDKILQTWTYSTNVQVNTLNEDVEIYAIQLNLERSLPIILIKIQTESWMKYPGKFSPWLHHNWLNETSAAATECGCCQSCYAS